jgi:hypothetical protein
MAQKRRTPAGQGGGTSIPHEGSSNSSQVCRQLRARRFASWRLPLLETGRSDPWHYEPPTAGYEEAALHLLEHGLTPAPNPEGLRLMWRSGGQSLQAAEFIAQAWELLA